MSATPLFSTLSHTGLGVDARRSFAGAAVRFEGVVYVPAWWSRPNAQGSGRGASGSTRG